MTKTNQDDNWTVISIHKQRMNAIKWLAEKRDKSYGSILDGILEKANVGYMSDEELEKKLKEKEVAA